MKNGVTYIDDLTNTESMAGITEMVRVDDTSDEKTGTIDNNIMKDSNSK